MNKNTLAQAIHDSVKNLQEGIDRHCCLVASMLKEDVDERNLKPLLDAHPPKSRETVMKDAIKDAIETLEASRKAFKSKQLEALRKRLTQVLIDAE